MSHIVAYEQARSEMERALCAIEVVRHKNSKRLAWYWAGIAVGHAENAGIPNPGYHVLGDSWPNCSELERFLLARALSYLYGTLEDEDGRLWLDKILPSQLKSTWMEQAEKLNVILPKSRPNGVRMWMLSVDPDEGPYIPQIAARVEVAHLNHKFSEVTVERKFFENRRLGAEAYVVAQVPGHDGRWWKVRYRDGTEAVYEQDELIKLSTRDNQD